MNEENVSEYDHDILILISTAQKVKAVEKKANSINPHMQTRQTVVGKLDYLPSLGRQVLGFNL